MPSYQWPASALTADDMALLHEARERGSPRTPINRLLARAVRLVFGQAAGTRTSPVSQPVEVPPLQEAA